MSPTPRNVPASAVRAGHIDFPVLDTVACDIRTRVPHLAEVYAALTVDALELVLDPVRTGRTRLNQLDNVEKTFVGLKIEHLLRELLQAPKGIRDLVLAGHNVDVKNTVGQQWNWMIPPETYTRSEPCLLAALDEDRRQAWLGLIVARPDYLGAPNRDRKRGILRPALSNILWLAEGLALPADRWADIDMERFLELRKLRGGNIRAATFFEENLRKPIHRTVVQALLHDQHDYMKRLRGNGGAKSILRPKGIALLSGTFFGDVVRELGIGPIRRDEHIAIDARTPHERAVLCALGEL